MAIDKAKLNPRQLSVDGAYISSQPFVHPARKTPQVTDTAKWRLVAREPINRMARRMIQREIASLNFEIVPEDPKSQMQLDAAVWYNVVFKDFRTVTTRTLKSVCELPQGGAWEVGWIKPGLYGEGEQGTLSFVEYIDAGTLHPTLNRAFPIVQIDPIGASGQHTVVTNLTDTLLTSETVRFKDEEINRVLGWPRDEFGLEWWQESPTEASFLAIEALSRIYVYSLKQLRDTPMAGLLDLMDFSEEDALEWAKNFRQMLQGIDPIKIPILYQHEQPARWLPMGNNFSELEIPRQFKMYADLVLGNYGLSVNDLRIFDQDQTKAGSAVSRKISLKQGIRFFAELMKDAVQPLLPQYLTFQYTEPDLEDERTKAQIRAVDARALQTLGMPLEYVLKEAKARSILLTDIDPEEVAEEVKEAEAAGEPTGVKGIGRPTPGQITQGEGRVPDALEEDAKATAKTGTRTFAKMVQNEVDTLIEKAVTTFKQNFSASKFGRKKRKASRKLESVFNREFRAAGRRFTKGKLLELLVKVQTQFPDLLLRNIDDPMQAKAWTDYVSNLSSNGLVTKQDDDLLIRAAELLSVLLDEDDFYNIGDEELLEEIMLILKLGYEDGLLGAAELVQSELHAKGVAKSPHLRISFNVVDESVIKLLLDHAAETVRLINEGTKYYLNRMIVEGVSLGMSVDQITDNIQRDLFGLPEEEAGKLNRSRIRSIVTTEINRADTLGRLKQMKELGFKLKRWLTRKVDVCILCIKNESEGSVALDFEYNDVFGKTLGPPGHPSTCHCSIGADANELDSIGTTPEYWTGGKSGAKSL
jgi:hypothetical protein